MNGLLISSPHMRDAHFARTVVLICNHNRQGALGLVINRDNTVRLGEVLARLKCGKEGDYPAWVGWGGPVGESTGFVVWRGDVGPQEGWSLAGGVAVSPSAERLQQLVREGRSFDLILGYAGWGPNQLESEVEQGSWLFADLDARIVLDLPREERYHAALNLLGLHPGEVGAEIIEA